MILSDARGATRVMFLLWQGRDDAGARAFQDAQHLNKQKQIVRKSRKTHILQISTSQEGVSNHVAKGTPAQDVNNACTVVRKGVRSDRLAARRDGKRVTRGYKQFA